MNHPNVLTTVLLLALLAALWPAPATAQVDTWRVLHVGLQSGAATDTDSDGAVNSWYTCKQRGNSKKAHCQFSKLYDMWQDSMACFPDTVERWTGYQIAIEQDQIFIETSDYLLADPYQMAWSGYASDYGFSEYDVVIVWTAFTQPPRPNMGDGNAWGPLAGTTDYGFIWLYGVGWCDSWHGGIVPPHEFSHQLSINGMIRGFAVCPIYDYPYMQYGEEDGHTMILTNQFPATTCAQGPYAGGVSTGIPPEAYAAGSYRDYYD
jgi:hypothetical protein